MPTKFGSLILKDTSGKRPEKTLPLGTTTIGSTPKCDIRFSHKFQTAVFCEITTSHTHQATVTRRLEEIPVSVNARALPVRAPRPLLHEDEIGVGGRTLIYSNEAQRGLRPPVSYRASLAPRRSVVEEIVAAWDSDPEEEAPRSPRGRTALLLQRGREQGTSTPTGAEQEVSSTVADVELGSPIRKGSGAEAKRRSSFRSRIFNAALDRRSTSVGSKRGETRFDLSSSEEELAADKSARKPVGLSDDTTLGNSVVSKADETSVGHSTQADCEVIEIQAKRRSSFRSRIFNTVLERRSTPLLVKKDSTKSDSIRFDLSLSEEELVANKSVRRQSLPVELNDDTTLDNSVFDVSKFDETSVGHSTTQDEVESPISANSGVETEIIQKDETSTRKSIRNSLDSSEAKKKSVETRRSSSNKRNSAISAKTDSCNLSSTALNVPNTDVDSVIDELVQNTPNIQPKSLETRLSAANSTIAQDTTVDESHSDESEAEVSNAEGRTTQDRSTNLELPVSDALSDSEVEDGVETENAIEDIQKDATFETSTRKSLRNSIDTSEANKKPLERLSTRSLSVKNRNLSISAEKDSVNLSSTSLNVTTPEIDSVFDELVQNTPIIESKSLKTYLSTVKSTIGALNQDATVDEADLDSSGAEELSDDDSVSSNSTNLESPVFESLTSNGEVECDLETLKSLNVSNTLEISTCESAQNSKNTNEAEEKSLETLPTRSSIRTRDSSIQAKNDSVKLSSSDLNVTSENDKIFDKLVESTPIIEPKNLKTNSLVAKLSVIDLNRDLTDDEFDYEENKLDISDDDSLTQNSTTNLEASISDSLVSDLVVESDVEIPNLSEILNKDSTLEISIRKSTNETEKNFVEKPSTRRSLVRKRNSSIVTKNDSDKLSSNNVNVTLTEDDQILDKSADNTPIIEPRTRSSVAKSTITDLNEDTVEESDLEASKSEEIGDDDSSTQNSTTNRRPSITESLISGIEVESEVEIPSSPEVSKINPTLETSTRKSLRKSVITNVTEIKSLDKPSTRRSSIRKRNSSIQTGNDSVFDKSAQNTPIIDRKSLKSVAKLSIGVLSQEKNVDESVLVKEINFDDNTTKRRRTNLKTPILNVSNTNLETESGVETPKSVKVSTSGISFSSSTRKSLRKSIKTSKVVENTPEQQSTRRSSIKKLISSIQSKTDSPALGDDLLLVKSAQSTPIIERKNLKRLSSIGNLNQDKTKTGKSSVSAKRRKAKLSTSTSSLKTESFIETPNLVRKSERIPSRAQSLIETSVKKNDLIGTPIATRSSITDSTRLDGMGRLFKTPRVKKSPLNDLSNVKGVKKLLSTPKQQKSPRNDLTKISGVKKMFKSAKKAQKSPRNDLRNVIGIKKLLRTGRKAQKSPKNDLRQIPNVKPLFNLRVELIREPLNDLSNVKGVKKLFLDAEKSKKSPMNDLRDVRGVRALMRTRKTKRELNDSVLEGVGCLFEENGENRSGDGKKRGRQPKNVTFDATPIRKRKHVKDKEENDDRMEQPTRSKRGKKSPIVGEEGVEAKVVPTRSRRGKKMEDETSNVEIKVEKPKRGRKIVETGIVAESPKVEIVENTPKKPPTRSRRRKKGDDDTPIVKIVEETNPKKLPTQSTRGKKVEGTPIIIESPIKEVSPKKKQTRGRRGKKAEEGTAIVETVEISPKKKQTQSRREIKADEGTPVVAKSPVREISAKKKQIRGRRGTKVEESTPIVEAVEEASPKKAPTRSKRGKKIDEGTPIVEVREEASPKKKQTRVKRGKKVEEDTQTVVESPIVKTIEETNPKKAQSRRGKRADEPTPSIVESSKVEVVIKAKKATRKRQAEKLEEIAEPNPKKPKNRRLQKLEEETIIIVDSSKIAKSKETEKPAKRSLVGRVTRSRKKLLVD